MATYTNIDIQRIFDSPANLTTRMINGQFAYDVTNDRIAVKRLADGVMKYFANNTDDTYLNADGTTPLTGDWDAGDFDITNVNILDVDNLTVTESMIVSGAVTLSSLTASRIVFTDADKDLVSDTSTITSANLTELIGGGVTTLHGHGGAGTDELVKVDSGATADYIGSAYNNGVLRITNTELSWADGGDYVTIGLNATLKSNYDAAYSHIHNLTTDIDHDALTNFVANEHINHTSVSISAGTGLTGGGDISASRTISLSHLGLESLTDPGADRIMFWDESENALKWLSATNGLSLSGTTLTVNAAGVDHNSLLNTHNLTTDIDHDALTNFVANEHITHNSVSISSGTGLTGGGDISVSRTISLSHLGIESLTDPGADRIMFWDESENALKWLTVSTGLSISTTSLSCSITQYTDENAQDAVGTILADSSSINFTYTDATPEITAVVIPGGVDHNSLNNTHNLTTDIDHDALTNFASNEHFTQSAITAISSGLGTGLVKSTSGTLSVITDGSTNWDAAYSHISADGTSHTYIDQDLRTSASPTFAGETLSGNLIFSSNSAIRLDTLDGSDDGYLRIAGGGTADATRGAFIRAHGNEHTNTGILSLAAGNVSGGNITLDTGGSTRVTIDYSGNVNIVGLTASRLVLTDGSKNLISDTSGITSANLSTLIGGGDASALHTHTGIDTDKYVGIDSGATPGYIGAAAGDGVLRVDSTLDWVDGGNYVTFGLDATLKSNYDAAYTHISASGASHTYINQDVKSTADPSFYSLLLSGSGSVDTSSSGGLNLKMGIINGVPSSATDSFVGVNNTGGPGSIAGDLLLISRSNVNAGIRMFTGNGTIVERLSISSSGDINIAKLTASRVVVTDGSKNLASSSVTSTNLTSMLTHISSDGTDHTYIDQDLRTTASPTHNYLTITNDLTVDTDTLFVDASLDRVGINDATPSYDLDVNGRIRTTDNIKVDGLFNSRIVFTDSSGLLETPSSITSANLTSMYNHISSDGTDHTYINQDLRTTAGPTFASAIITNNLTVNGNLILDNVLALNRATQTITSDNDTLLEVSGTSFLYVETSTSGSPTSYTVGLEAGDYDGHMVCIVAVGADAFEINDSVSGSADTSWSGNKITIDTSNPVILIWEDNYDTWCNASPVLAD